MNSIIAFGMVWNVITSILNKRSAQSSFSFINFVQLILLIPLIGAYLSPNVLDFIRGMKVWLLNFNFISLPNFNAINLMKYIDFEQDNSYLQSISLESGSIGINIYYIIGTSLLIPLIHAIIFICNKCIQNKFSENKCTHNLIRKLYRAMTFGWYIRFIWEIYVFLLLASISEIYMFSNSSTSRQVSLSIACLIIVFLRRFCLSVSLANISSRSKTSVLIACSTSQSSSAESRQLAKQEFSRLYFCFRRTMFCWIVLLLHHAMSLTFVELGICASSALLLKLLNYRETVIRSERQHCRNT